MDNRKVKIHKFKKDQVIFRQGEKGTVFYKILSGSVHIYSNYDKKEELFLAKLEMEYCFGEMSVLEGRPRSATAVAAEDTVVAAYPDEMLDTLVYQNPRFGVHIMRNLSKSLRNTTEELQKMHGMLLDMSKHNPTSDKIQKYIKEHTVYLPDGTPQYYLKI